MHSEPSMAKLRAAIEGVLKFFKFVTILRFRTVFGVPQPIFSDLVILQILLLEDIRVKGQCVPCTNVDQTE